MEDNLQLNTNSYVHMNSQNYAPSTPIVGTNLSDLYQRSNAGTNSGSNSGVRPYRITNQSNINRPPGTNRNVKIHNCHVRDVGLEQKTPASVEWTRVSGTITANGPTSVSVKEGYQFRTFTAGGSSQSADVNNIQENDTVYVWDDGNISMIGCQPQCIKINNCYNTSLTLQMSTDGRNWQDFMIDGQAVVIYGQSPITVDIPGGVFLRLTDKNIISGIYRVPVDPLGLERFPVQVFFRTNGTTSTSTCQTDTSEIIVHNCYNVSVSVEVQDNSGFRTIADLAANSFSDALQVKEGGQVRLVNTSQNIRSGTFTVTERSQTVIYFRTDGGISHTTCKTNISVNAFNCGAVNLQVQVRGTEGDDWVTISGVAVAGQRTRLQVRGGSQMRLVSADESFTSQTFNIPQNQSDVPDTIHFRKDGQISAVGCEMATGPPRFMPPTMPPVMPLTMPPTMPPGNGLVTLLTINNCYSMVMTLQNRINGQWVDFTINIPPVTTVNIPAGGNVTIPVMENIVLRLISMDGKTISGVANLTSPIPAEIFFRSDAHVSTNSCKLPCSTISNCYDFHMTLQEQLTNGTWQNISPEVTLCAKESVDIVDTLWLATNHADVAIVPTINCIIFLYIIDICGLT